MNWRSKSEGLVPAIVLGFNHTALGIIRALGRKGVPVYAVDYTRRGVGIYSKYCQGVFHCPDFRSDDQGTMRRISSILKKLGRSVIFPSNDDSVHFLVKNYDAVKKNAYMSFSDPNITYSCLNKKKFYHIAQRHSVRVPLTHFPANQSELNSILNLIRYPCIIKPVLSKKFEHREGTKAKKVFSREELQDSFNYYSGKYSIMVQELVAGPDEDQYSVASYWRSGGEPVALFQARKCRSFPIEFGAGTLVESERNPECAKIARKFMKDIAFQGIAEIEFKRDKVSGQLKIIEVNPRAWGQISLAEKCGLNFAYYSYLDAIGRLDTHLDRISFTNGIKWFSLYRDIYAFADYRNAGLLTLEDYLHSLTGKIMIDEFAWDDPIPFVYYVIQGKSIRYRNVFKLSKIKPLIRAFIKNNSNICKG